ncbi:MAG: hypothetical protein ACC726_15420, partial [Chloroflexota bacterium]
PYEFAVAQLDDDALAEIMAAARRGPTIQLDAELPGARIDTRDVAVRARRDFALLQQALRPRLALDGGVDEAAARADAREHVWLRMPFGAETLDLDTTLADAEPGDVLATPEQTLRDLPADLRHTIRLQLILEESDQGNLSERVVLDERLDAIDASERELFLLIEPDFSGLAGAINAVLSGDERWSPVLLSDGERTVGDSFSAGGRGQDLLGDPTELPEPVSLRLLATVEGPGLEPITATHVLFDRSTDGSLPGFRLGDTPLDPLEFEAGIPTVLTGIVNLVVSTGGSSPRTFAYQQVQVLDFIEGALLDDDIAAQYSLADRLWPMAMASEALVLTSEQVLVPAAGGAGGHGYVARPRLYVASISPALGDPEAVVAVTDLMLDSVRILPDAPNGPTAAGQLWYGVLQSALETELGLRTADALVEDEPLLAGASLSMDPPLVVLSAGVTTSPDGAPAALRRDLESGLIAVLSGDATSATSWWTIDPDSGATRAILAPGLRGVRDVTSSQRDRADVFDTIWQKDKRGSRTKVRKARPRGGVDRVKGHDPRDYTRKKPGLPQNQKLKLPRSRTPPLRQPPAPRCTGKGEYMTVVGCVSLPTAGVFYLLGAVYVGSITGITYGLLKIWRE